ncbi:MAG TPA: pitrilysin family protein [Candidatus Polarisedimenticolia bacterium]|jgi:zinc protease|nr:pitrilysin family protein [Candidatus Polarisedimenticolia bacterium]
MSGPGRLRGAAWALALLGSGPIGAFAAPPSVPPKPSATAAASGFHVPSPARTILKNGLTVLVLERRTIPLVQLRLMVKSGSTSDPAGKEGTAALTARLLKRGTKARPAGQFFEEVEFVGGSIDTMAGLDASYVWGEFATRDLEVAFNLFSDLVLNPAFRPEEFEKEKRLALADLVDSLDDPGRVAQRAFAAWLYGSHPYGRPVDGTQRSVTAISRDDAASFYESRYAPNNAVLAIVGDVDAAQAARSAERYFSAWKKKTVTAAAVAEAAGVKGRKVLLVDKPDATQSQIRFGNVGIRRADPDYVPLIVGNTVLGGGFTSWLTNEVRVKRGLTYSIASRVEALRSSGSIFVSTFSRNASVLETIQVALEQVRRLRGGDLPPEDLDKSRSYLAGLYPLRIESPEDLAAEILNVDLFGLEPDFINQYQKRVRSTAADAVKRVAARRLPMDDLAIVVVGPAQALRKDLATLGPVTVRPIQSALDGGGAAAPARP